MSAPASGAEPEAERIRAAMIALVAERGYPQLTPHDLYERAGVGRRAFERHFESLDACFAAIWIEFNARLLDLMDAAFEGGGDAWRGRIRAALDASFGLLAAEPDLARLYIVDSIFSGDPVRPLRTEARERLARMIDSGRAEAIDPQRVPPLVAEALAGGIWHRVEMMVSFGRVAGLPGEVREMMYMVVLPYLGIRAAREEYPGPAPP